jgi:hypothetical protein
LNAMCHLTVLQNETTKHSKDLLHKDQKIDLPAR